MTQETRPSQVARCERCGHLPAASDKFCAECGNFLRDAWLDHRLLLAVAHQQEGRTREAQQELVGKHTGLRSHAGDHRTPPAWRSSRPHTIEIVVVLPAPLGPRRP